MGEVATIGVSCLMQSSPTLFSNNLSVIYLSTNLVFYSHMKHLVIDYHFVRDLV